jgi:hypothetical protein
MQARAALKTRFREAVVARKSRDADAARARGVELLAVLRKNAKADLEALEAAFLDAKDLEPLIARLECGDDAQ